MGLLNYRSVSYCRSLRADSLFQAVVVAKGVRCSSVAFRNHKLRTWSSNGRSDILITIKIIRYSNYVRWLLKSNESFYGMCVFISTRWFICHLFIAFPSSIDVIIWAWCDLEFVLHSTRVVELFANGPFCSPVLLTFSSFAVAWRVRMGFLSSVAILLTVLINPATPINPTFVWDCVLSICLNLFRVQIGRVS
jgi:hypothetical protein